MGAASPLQGAGYSGFAAYKGGWKVVHSFVLQLTRNSSHSLQRRSEIELYVMRTEMEVNPADLVLLAGALAALHGSANSPAGSESSCPGLVSSSGTSDEECKGQKLPGEESASESATESGSGEDSYRQRLNEMSMSEIQRLLAHPFFCKPHPPAPPGQCPFHQGSPMMSATGGGLKCSRCGLVVREPTEEQGRRAQVCLVRLGAQQRASSAPVWRSRRMRKSQIAGK